MDISVIIVTRNAEECFDECLRSLYSNKMPGSYEVIVVDSGSTDSTIPIAKKYPVRLYQIPRTEFHHGKTRNYGARLAAGDILVYLTADAIPIGIEWMSNLIRPLKDGTVAATYGRQLPRNTNVFESYFLDYLYPEQGAVRKLEKNQTRIRLRDIFFSDVNSAIKREVWEKHKFHESIVLSEDQDWAKRVLLDGYEIAYVPAAAVYHSHNYRLKRLFRRNFDSGASLKDLTNEPFASSVAELARYLAGEARFVFKNGKPREIMNFIPYESVRILGFVSGLNERVFPSFIKPYMSTQPHHWRKADR